MAKVLIAEELHLFLGGDAQKQKGGEDENCVFTTFYIQNNNLSSPNVSTAPKLYCPCFQSFAFHDALWTS